MVRERCILVRGFPDYVGADGITAFLRKLPQEEPQFVFCMKQQGVLVFESADQAAACVTDMQSCKFEEANLVLQMLPLDL